MSSSIDSEELISLGTKTFNQLEALKPFRMLEIKKTKQNTTHTTLLP